MLNLNRRHIANPDLYDDYGYMVNAFKKGASGCAELSKFLPAVTDELWKMGYSNEDIAKMYGGNMIRVFKKVWK
jgi:membrane dipeptidase